MKKVFIPLALVPILFAVPACTIPSSFQIKGSREISIPASKNIGDLLKIENVIDLQGMPAGTKTPLNTVPDTLTYAAFIPAYYDTANFRSILNISLWAVDPAADVITYNNGKPLDISDQIKGKFDLNLDKLKKALNNFKFREIKSQVYIQTNNYELTKILSLELTLPNGTPKKATGLRDSIFKNIDADNTISLPDLPNYDPGRDLELTDFINNGSENMDIQCTLKLEGQIHRADLDVDNAEINVELAIWLPLDLVAGPGGADLDIASYFGGERNDLFGRAAVDEKNAIIDAFDAFDNLELKVLMTKNPFKNGRLIIDCEGLGEIPNKMEANAVSLILDKNSMSYFRHNFFIPNLSLHLDEGKGFSIPRSLWINSLNLKGALNYEVFP